GDFTDTTLRIKPDASRYEGGTHNLVGFLGLAASMAMFTQFSGAEIEQRLREVTDECCERLQSAGATLISERADARWSGILAVDVPGRNPLEIKKDCLRQQVVVNARNGHVRISPHVYTTSDDVERLIASLFA